MNNDQKQPLTPESVFYTTLKAFKLFLARKIKVGIGNR